MGLSQILLLSTPPPPPDRIGVPLGSQVFSSIRLRPLHYHRPLEEEGKIRRGGKEFAEVMGSPDGPILHRLRDNNAVSTQPEEQM